MKHVDATRVEVGQFVSNSNSRDYDRPWEPWEGRLTDRVTFIGVQRKVRFSKAFDNAPKVISALSLINVAPLDLVMRESGYSISDRTEDRRLKELHVVSYPTDVTAEDFELRVGIGLPRPCADYIIGYLNRKTVDDDTVATSIRFGALNPTRSPGQLTQQERWMMNFYTTVGTLIVTWVARADQK